LSSVPSPPVVLTLNPGGALHVTCSQDDHRLSTYRLTWWPSSNPDIHNVMALDQPDFLLEGLPIGEVFLVASVPGQSQSTTTRATILSGTANSINIHIADGFTCTGTIIDGATGLPVDTAKIQVYVNDQGARLIPLAGLTPVDSQG